MVLLINGRGVLYLGIKSILNENFIEDLYKEEKHMSYTIRKVLYGPPYKMRYHNCSRLKFKHTYDFPYNLVIGSLSVP